MTGLKVEQIAQTCSNVLKKYFYTGEGLYLNIEKIEYGYGETEDYENPSIVLTIRYGRYDEDPNHSAVNFDDEIEVPVEEDMSFEFIAGVFYGKLATKEWGE